MKSVVKAPFQFRLLLPYISPVYLCTVQSAFILLFSLPVTLQQKAKCLGPATTTYRDDKYSVES